MNRAFTIIEVLISVAIISIVLLALLKTGSNNLKTAHFVKNREKVLSLTSFFINKNENKIQTNLYKVLENKYNINNDKLRKRLKEIKIIFKSKDLGLNLKMSKIFERYIGKIKLYEKSVFLNSYASSVYSIDIK